MKRKDGKELMRTKLLFSLAFSLGPTPGELAVLSNRLEKIDLIQSSEINSNRLRFQDHSPFLITGMT
jgi:hypothetical protein